MLYFASMVFGLAILMIVHESGHYFVARAFGMRVERFSIGFGPAIWKHQSKEGTVFQVAVIPFLAYVQIAGMNPFEEHDPDDSGSYANASLVARVSAIAAGPLANYLFASVVFFAVALIGGKASEEPIVTVVPKSAAERAGLVEGDRIVAIDGQQITRWVEIPKSVRSSPEKPLHLTIDRKGKRLEIEAIPDVAKDKDPITGAAQGFLGVGPARLDVPVREALTYSVMEPAAIVIGTITSLARAVVGKEQVRLVGPFDMAVEAGKAAEMGLTVYLAFLGFLSTSVGFFNMLPFPALDGGRLIFLTYEAVTRRRPNQRIEAQIHMVGMLMLLATLVFVTFREVGSKKSASEILTEQKAAAAKARADKAATEKSGPKTLATGTQGAAPPGSAAPASP